MEVALAYAALAAHVAILVLVITLLVRWARKKTPFDPWLRHLSTYGVALALIVALSSVLGSLFYSEVLKFDPCLLCWYQRIFMFPLVIILGLAVWKDRTDVSFYSIPLAIAGAIVAAYHVALQFAPSAPSLVDCTLGGVDCAVPYTAYFGYISIPVMSLTSFVLIILFLWLSRKQFIEFEQ